MRLADAREVPEDLRDRKVQIGKGNLDPSMPGPVACNLTVGGKVMHAKEPDAPDLAKNLRLPMLCHCCGCHVAVKKDGLMELHPDAPRYYAKVATV